jgi:hypothetical protein
VDEKTLRKMIEQLHRELREIRYALWALESVAAGKPRRGRPPKTEPSAPRKKRGDRTNRKKQP